LAEPRQTFGGRYLRRTIFDKAAALFRSVDLNHGLVDGNKRLALATVALFLSINGYILYAPRNEAVAFALRVASADQRPELEEMSRWFRRHSIRLSAFFAMSSSERAKRLGIVGEAEAIRVVLRVAEAEIRALEKELKQLGMLEAP